MIAKDICRWAIFVVGFSGVGGCNAAEPGQWTQWTPSVNGLSFRVRTLAEGPNESRSLPVELSIRNTGEAPIAIVHPGRINAGELTASYRPFTVLGPFRKYEMPVPNTQDNRTEENVVILSRGDILTTKAAILIQDMSPGVHSVWLAIPCQWWPSDLQAENIGMSKEYFAKVRPLLWSQPIPNTPVSIGPLKITLVQNNS